MYVALESGIRPPYHISVIGSIGRICKTKLLFKRYCKPTYFCVQHLINTQLYYILQEVAGVRKRCRFRTIQSHLDAYHRIAYASNIDNGNGLNLRPPVSQPEGTTSHFDSNYLHVKIEPWPMLMTIYKARRVIF